MCLPDVFKIKKTFLILNIVHMYIYVCLLAFFFPAIHSFVQGALFLVTAVLYLSRRPEYLDVMVVCLALSWVNILYFSRGDRHMGIYSIMIQKV